VVGLFLLSRCDFSTKYEIREENQQKTGADSACFEIYLGRRTFKVHCDIKNTNSNVEDKTKT